MTRNRGLAGFASAISGPVNIPDLNVGIITAASGNITGNLGIGTDNPTEELHIAATVPTIRFEDTDHGYAGRILQSGSSLYLDADYSNVGSGAIRFRVGGANEKMRIDSSGNLGIGTNNPSLKLEVAGSAAFSNNVGIQTDNITRGDLVGAGNSFVGMYIGDGFLAFSTSLSRSDGYYISTSINALNAGPVTLGSTMTIDGTWVIV